MGLALSGGGDSQALAVLAAAWARPRGVALRAASVDHRLRAEATDEIALAARTCAALGIPHSTLVWEASPGTGNLQAAARRARQDLLGAWAVAAGLDYVALGHTRDDQAETVLLRLARGSGVDGLAGMAPLRAAGGITWLRPLLQVDRAALRAVLREAGVTWADDPGNADSRFHRVRARHLLAETATLGLDAETLAETAERMAAARHVLRAAAVEAAARIARVDRGDVLLAADALATLPSETRWRLLAQALCAVGGQVYRPRLKALRRIEAALAEGRGATLHGCLIRPFRRPDPHIRVMREPAAVAGCTAPAPGPWDGRWQVTGPDMPGARTACLGPAGLALRPDWRKAGLPHAAVLASPAVWTGSQLLAAPLLDPPGAWRATAHLDAAAFTASLLSD